MLLHLHPLAAAIWSPLDPRIINADFRRFAGLLGSPAASAGLIFGVVNSLGILGKVLPPWIHRSLLLSQTGLLFLSSFDLVQVGRLHLLCVVHIRADEKLGEPW